MSAVAPDIGKDYGYEFFPGLGLIPCQRVLLPVTTPGAGAGWTYIVQGGAHELILAITQTFTASAVVATRTPSLRYQDGDGIEYAVIPATAAITASQVARMGWNYGTETQTSPSATVQAATLPKFIVEPGHRIVLNVNAIDAADQVSVIRVLTLRLPQITPGDVLPQGIVVAGS